MRILVVDFCCTSWKLHRSALRRLLVTAGRFVRLYKRDFCCASQCWTEPDHEAQKCLQKCLQICLCDRLPESANFATCNKTLEESDETNEIASLGKHLTEAYRRWHFATRNKTWEATDVTNEMPSLGKHVTEVSVCETDCTQCTFCDVQQNLGSD